MVWQAVVLYCKVELLVVGINDSNNNAFGDIEDIGIEGPIDDEHCETLLEVGLSSVSKPM